jgi:hypothetical protein
MSEAKVEKIKEASQKILVRVLSVALRLLTRSQGSSFQTGVQVSDKRKRVIQISSGSKSVDAMLGGGFMSQSISEGAFLLALLLVLMVSQSTVNLGARISFASGCSNGVSDSGPERLSWRIHSPSWPSSLPKWAVRRAK